ncbi:LysM peptidoglycan-binding domain-containing protein [Botrimarina sp.]|uniref:LysM peptidoglycan-binding domain-containing protein n=1 Tax=Botrimarina sp. TaxID=2795802 RepID=UPI0032EF366D
MSTIRPLATIAVLAVVGAFLAWKINEGPTVALDDSWATEADTAAAAAPPAWPSPDAPANGADEGSSSLTPRAAPAWDSASAEPAPAAAPSLSLPPIAAAPAAPPQPTVSGRVPSLGSSTSDLAPTTDLAKQSPPAPMLPEAPGAPPAPERTADREVTPAAASTPLAADAPATAPGGFDAAWPAIQAALQNDELARAHRMLSQWALDPSLPQAEREQVEQLLSGLAGTVVYSMEHHLEQPHVVASGETLATIAEQYEVPWQLLAKINGVSSAEAVQPGQELKVVRGPFDARVDLARGEMVLLLDDRYAGKFPVRVTGAQPSDGLWQVDQKQLEPTAAPDRLIVLSGAGGESVELSASPTPTQRTQLAVASRDLEDLFDILSVGSSVTILR